MEISLENRNESYFSLTNKGKQQKLIKNSLIHEDFTINELSRVFKIPASTISARINELKPNAYSVGKKVDNLTNRSVTIWRYNDQLDLFNSSKTTKIAQIKKLCENEKSELSIKILKIINNG